MNYLLDTTICIEVIRHKRDSLIGKFIAMNLDQMSISTITVAELQFGVAKSKYKEQNTIALTKFLTPLTVLPFDAKAADAYGEIRANLQGRGLSIGPLDTLIAAHAVSQNMTLVTNNMREFKRVTNLKLENWVELSLPDA
jgi:tRNA(fMet)-specific endonuclease VapC